MSIQRKLKSACAFALHTWLSKMCPVKIVIRLRECAGWSESSLDACVRRYVFWRCAQRVWCMYITLTSLCALYIPTHPTQPNQEEKELMTDSTHATKIGLTYAISIVKWFFFSVLSKKYGFLFFAELELLVFHNNIVTISEKKNEPAEPVKICLQVTCTYHTEFCKICIYFYYGKK